MSLTKLKKPILEYDPRNYSPKDFLNNIENFGINPKNGLRFLGAVIGNGELDPINWSKAGIIEKKLALTLETLPSLTLEKIESSKIDNFKKLLFRTYDNLFIETVIIPLHIENRVSICLSSQVGCVMACDFFATAKMKNRRNLLAWEIFDQMRYARIIAKEDNKKVTSCVFMGMGEPFLNYDNVLKTAENLCFPVINAISSKSITISTVGILDKIHKFIDEKRPFRLSISLGAATDEKRKKLVPVASKTSLQDIINAAKKYSAQRKDRINLSYVCISGENISIEDAKNLAKVIGDLKVRLDLIDVYDSAGVYKKPSDSEISEFRTHLNTYLRQPVARRYSGGSDINASCGTLAGNL